VSRRVVIVTFSVLLLVSGCDWSQPRFGPARTGHNPFTTAVGTGNVAQLGEIWTRSLNGPGTDPVVADGTVFVAVSGRNGGAGHVYAKDVTTGATRWKLRFAGLGCRPGICVSAGVSLTVSNGKVFVGVALTQQGELSAYDAQTGALLHSYSGASTGRPVVAAGRLFANYYDGGFGIAAWDLSNDSFLFRTEGGAAAFPALAVDSGRVFEQRAGELRVFDATGTTNCSGSPKVCTPLWTATASGSPAVDAGTVYVGADAFDASGCGAPTCSPIWSAVVGGPAGSVAHASPAVAEGVLYLGSSDENLYAFDASGCGAPTCAPLWTAGTGGVVRSPTVANGVVYVGSDNGKLRAFDASGCAIPKCALWKVVLGVSVEDSPAVSSAGRVYAATSDGVLHAFGLPS
jgi:outer membrane protein assembly factor BamB